MKKPLLFAATLLVTLPASLPAAEFNLVQPDKSAIGFTFRQMNVPVHGRFPKFTAQLAFDPAKPDAARVNIAIDTSAIDAGSSEANDEVAGKPWFNVRMFPTATFTATGAKALGGGKYEMNGQLSIKGKSQPLSAPFTLKTEGTAGVFVGSFKLKRLDFAIGEGPWADVGTVANDVKVDFRIVAVAGPVAPTTPAKKK